MRNVRWLADQRGESAIRANLRLKAEGSSRCALMWSLRTQKFGGYGPSVEVGDSPGWRQSKVIRSGSCDYYRLLVITGIRTRPLHVASAMADKQVSLGRAFASKGVNWGRRQARALLAITAPISGCWLVPTNGAPLLVHKIGLTECCFQTPFFRGTITRFTTSSSAIHPENGRLQRTASTPPIMLVPRHTSDSA